MDGTALTISKFRGAADSGMVSFLEYPSSVLTGMNNRFAFDTISDRVPSIVTRVIDAVYRSCPPSSEKKEAIKNLGNLKFEMQTNKSLHFIANSAFPDEYNNEYESMLEYWKTRNMYTWFSIPMLLAECYVYHLIQIYVPCGFDCFAEEKQSHFHKSKRENLVSLLSETNLENISLNCLWANQADLSLHKSGCHQNGVDENLLLNNFPSFDFRNKTVHIVLDNSGIELLADLVLARYLARKECKVVLHFKQYPWFVSDCTIADLEFLQTELTEFSEGRALNDFINSSSNIFVESSLVWNSPLPIRHLNRPMYSRFVESDLVIFKGDLNYRKLLFDTHGLAHTNVSEACGNLKFDCLAIRTLKCDTLVGVNVKKKLEDDWMHSGKYGIIQYIPKSE